MPVLDKAFLIYYRTYFKKQGVKESIINQKCCAIRKLALEAVDMKIWTSQVVSDLNSVKNIPQRGKKQGIGCLLKRLNTY